MYASAAANTIRFSTAGTLQFTAYSAGVLTIMRPVSVPAAMCVVAMTGLLWARWGGAALAAFALALLAAGWPPQSSLGMGSAADLSAFERQLVTILMASGAVGWFAHRRRSNALPSTA